MSGTDFIDFELPNAGAWGPNPFALSNVAAQEGIRALVLLFQRDHYCVACREQVQTFADRYTELTDHGAHVASILPESEDRVASWQERYDLPFALLADKDKEVCDAYEQPRRFGLIGQMHDMVGLMPLTVIFDTRNAPPHAVFVHKGESPGDRPNFERILKTVADLEEGEPATV